MVKIKRVYSSASAGDGFRILVDRLWPRGLTKRRAKLDLWEKELAPSPTLRKWFGHAPRRWFIFTKRYAAELRNKPAHLRKLRDKEKSVGTVTLLFGAKDELRNNAAVLRDILMKSSTHRHPRG